MKKKKLPVPHVKSSDKKAIYASSYIWLYMSIVRYYFSGPHTNLYPELADCYNQPDHLCGVQSNLPGVSGQEVQVLGSSLKLSQRIKSNLRGESVENTGILIHVTSDF